jgi:uncharacterized protein (DUF885 family)
MQEQAERTISELHGTHFDIPQPAHRIEAVIAPTNDGDLLTEPSDDWSRPGRMCWSVPDGVETFATWKKSRSSTTRAFPATTCRYRTPWPSGRA